MSEHNADEWVAERFPQKLDENHHFGFISEEGRKVGLIEYHRKPDGEWCCGSIRWDAPTTSDSKRWTLHSLEPLHVEPSLLCTICGDHGFIRDGKWIPA